MATTEPPDDPVRRSRDVDVRVVVASGVWLIVASLAISVGLWGYFHLLKRDAGRRQPPESALVLANLRRTPPEPRLEANPLALRQRVRAEEDAILDSYGWVDKSAGIVRIPIDRAMDILAERGLPPAKPMPAAAAGTASSAAAPPNPQPAAPPPNPAGSAPPAPRGTP